MSDSEYIEIAEDALIDLAEAVVYSLPLTDVCARYRLDSLALNSILQSPEFDATVRRVRERFYSDVDRRADDAAALLENSYANDALLVASFWRSVLTDPTAPPLLKARAAEHLDKRIAGKDRIRSLRENRPAEGIQVNQVLNIAILEEASRALRTFAEYVERNPGVELSAPPD